MTREEYISRFDLAATSCLQFARKLVTDDLPDDLRLVIPWTLPEDSEGRMKFLGGRLLTHDDLTGASYLDTRKWLWVDGRTPFWINFNVSRKTESSTIIDPL